MASSSRPAFHEGAVVLDRSSHVLDREIEIPERTLMWDEVGVRLGNFIASACYGPRGELRDRVALRPVGHSFEK